MTKVARFVDDTGALPRDSHRRRSDPMAQEELRLARFLRYQRYNERYLTQWQREQLEALRQFEWSPTESGWDALYDACLGFVQAEGQVPRLRADDAEERRLAVWLRRQLLRRRHGTLPHHLLRALDRLLG